MKITQVRLGRISTPLRVPFKTALRTVNSVEDVIVELHTDTGAVGYGEAPPTGVITGDTAGAIIGAIQDHIAPAILGHDIDEFEDLTAAVQKALVHNTSAKAAVDMALWDLLGQKYNAPVYRMLGGARKNIVTDITISVNPPEEMARDARTAIARGYDCLKVQDLVMRGVCSVEDVDKALVYGPGIRWAIFGHNMIMQMGNPGGLTGMVEMLGNSGDHWLEDMASWTHQPDNWAQVAQPGVDQEMANFPDYIGHTNAECIAYRDQMLIDILKLHKKL